MANRTLKLHQSIMLEWDVPEKTVPFEMLRIIR
ncbi:hypothetical protein C7424_3908 [Pantoea ananatis]|nr:hypothetical protein C7421_11214 [Pantoea ananatis]REE67486.1 hypothetical protein C7424_3908 [Pantoea ananatis]